jgi:4'-phosphopantetheinyl transferase
VSGRVDRPDEHLEWVLCARDDVPEGLEWLSAPERAEAASRRLAVRRDGFLLRRWTARRALAARLGLDAPSLSGVTVQRDALGAPTAWRDGRRIPVTLSLTDRAGRACCVVGPAGLGLGCDLERIEPRSAAFVRDFLTAREQVFVRTGEGDDQDLRPALVWSAKESALKALGIGLRRDTRSLEVDLPAELPTEGVPDGWSPLTVRAADGRRFDGWWRREADLVLTVATDRPTRPPRRLAGDGRAAPVELEAATV